MIIGNKTFDTNGRVYVMGILNVTPDSFSDGGQFSHLDQALFHAEQMIKDGADVLDIGGESTRPGYSVIHAAEEIERVVPVIEALKERFDVPLSLDTYKSTVAEAGISAGADMINDIWGLRYDASMKDVLKKHPVAVCLTHNRNQPIYHNLLEDVMMDLKVSIDLAREAGLSDEQICIDPGIGFAKDLDQNLLLMKHLDKLKEFHLPILLGTSRKSMIGNTLHLPVEEREEGTIATTVFGITKGCSFIRVHDVKSNKRAIDMTMAMMHAKETTTE